MLLGLFVFLNLFSYYFDLLDQIWLKGFSKNKDMAKVKS